MTTPDYVLATTATDTATGEIVDGPPRPVTHAVLVKEPGPGLVSAKGDGVADDTIALNAIIEYCRLNMVPMLVPTGLYNISSPLLMCQPTENDVARGEVHDIQPGFILRGTTAASVQTIVTTGNMIRMVGTGQDSILQVGTGAVIGSQVENIGMDGGSAAQGTKCGIHTLVDHWSGFSVVNSRIQNVDWAIWIDGALGGGNGEQFNAYNCFFSGRLGCYKNTSPLGQALIHTLTSCGSLTDNGGTQFWMDDGQLNVFGWSCTQAQGTLPNVFLRLDGTLGGTCNFNGGRCEHVDILVSWAGGSLAQAGTVSIEGIEFVGMSGTKAFLFGGGTNCSYNFIIRSCSFGTQDPIAGPLIVDINSGSYERITFEDCTFSGWGGGYDQLSTNPHIKLLRCRWQAADYMWHDF